MKYLSAAFCLALIVFTASCKQKAAATTDTVSSATEAAYAEGELRQYEGTELTALSHFRENSISGVRHIDIAGYRLRLFGLIDRETRLTYAAVTNLASRKEIVKLDCVEGWSATVLWEGVPLRELFDACGGIANGARTVIFHADDGYTTSLPLAEVLVNDLMIAYRANGIPLPANIGFPFILVAKDKWGYKWARWITGIELSSNTNYRGYWEQRGYNNNGDLSGSKYER